MMKGRLEHITEWLARTCRWIVRYYKKIYTCYRTGHWVSTTTFKSNVAIDNLIDKVQSDRNRFKILELFMLTGG